MNQQPLRSQSLAHSFSNHQHSIINKLLLVFSGVLLLSLTSQLAIPLKPVPLTFQSATVVFIGMAYGARYGSYIIATYLLAGLLGAPVFAEYSAGPYVFFGPTAGYLLSFLPSALLSGYLMENGFSRNLFTRFIAALLGMSTIFLGGVLVLSQFVGWHAAWMLGVMPFMISEPIKIAAITVMAAKIRKSYGHSV